MTAKRKVSVAAKAKVGRVGGDDRRRSNPRLRQDARYSRLPDRLRVSKGPKADRTLDQLCFIPTWHPAYLFKDMARGARSFLLHVEKAVAIALGASPTPYPKVLKDPDEKTAREVFKSWEAEGWAVDVETPSLTEYRVVSAAVCGSQDLAMVWNCLRGIPRVLQEALRSPVRKIVQNGDFDINVLLACGCKLDPESFWDTMIEAQLQHPDEPVNLSFLASMACDIESWKWQKEGNLFFYNALDAWTDWLVYLRNQRAYEEEYN